MKKLIRKFTCKHTFMVKRVFNIYDGESKKVTILECPHCGKMKKKITVKRIIIKQDIGA